MEGNNVQCEPIEFHDIENFACFSNRGMIQIHFFPPNLNPSLTSDFPMCTLLKYGSGVAIMLVGNRLHKRLPFCCN